MFSIVISEAKLGRPLALGPDRNASKRNLMIEGLRSVHRPIKRLGIQRKDKLGHFYSSTFVQ
jgi:hypothetical protein